jgi:hypothetical protein
MNLAITSTSATLKTVKRHYLIALAGTCLAFTAIVAASGLSGLSLGGSAPAPAPPVIDLRQPEFRPSASVPPSPIFIYLAESQAKATEILAAVESDRNESEVPAPVFHAFKVTTAEEEVWVSEFVKSLQGRDVQIIDAR